MQDSIINNGAQLVIAEDDPDDLAMLINRIQILNPTLTIKSFPNGREALEYLQQCGSDALPKLIVIDYWMPASTGYDLLIAIRQEPRFQPILRVVYTVINDDEFIQMCLDSGAHKYLLKPSNLQGVDRVAREINDLLLL